MKILSASVKVIDDKNHVRILGLDEVEIKIKSAESPIKDIPEIPEEAPKKKTTKKTKSKK